MEDFKVGEGDQNDGVKEDQALNKSPTPEAKDPDDGTVEDVVNDHRLAFGSEEDANPRFDVDENKPGKEVPREDPIEYLLSPENRRVHDATPALLKRKDLIPCNKEGKKVYDHRIF